MEMAVEILPSFIKNGASSSSSRKVAVGGGVLSGLVKHIAHNNFLDWLHEMCNLCNLDPATRKDNSIGVNQKHPRLIWLYETGYTTLHSNNQNLVVRPTLPARSAYRTSPPLPPTLSLPPVVESRLSPPPCHDTS